MKFSIKRDTFLNELNNVIRAVPAQSNIPILTGLKLSAGPSSLTMTGSDSKISIISVIDSNEENNLTIEETGDVVLDGRLFSEIIRKLPENTVNISLDERNIAYITSGEAAFDLVGYDGNNYPQLPDLQVDNASLVPTVEFKTMIEKTLFSTSNQETRPILTGINISKLNQDTLLAIATDSHRLSRYELNIQGVNLDFDEITLPKKTAQELIRIVDDNDELYMQVINQQAVFLVNNLTIISRLIDGNYPPTDRLIPQTHTTELVLNSRLLAEAVDRAALMSNNKMNNSVQLVVDSDRVELHATGGERGQASENVSYLEANGEPLQISFNFNYMKDALGAFDGADVRIQFQGPSSPFVIIPNDDENEKHKKLLQLMTPIRTHNTY